ncbi:MAG TPA: GNAT family N-acetyltransferase [Sediminibacterium sp.]|nr:GNAT family N-acetyltransferase [Sediminibacterium sp.]
MQPDLQPGHLSSEWVTLHPLKPEDFEQLYAVASDPLIWEQHPNKNRYRREVFENFFKGAIESGGAFLITDTKTGKPIGSSRFCNYNEAEGSIEIGYTFYARSCWGKEYNRSAKALMIQYAFDFSDTVIFHIGAGNIRSQKAIEKIGARKTGEESHQYFGEAPVLNFNYAIKKTDWETTSAGQLPQ